eukprot:6369936-Ditylum_brightwellii.AAC.1
MTSVEHTYTQLPNALQTIQPPFEYFAGDAKLKRELKRSAANIALEKKLKRHNELIEVNMSLYKEEREAEKAEKKRRRSK